MTIAEATEKGIAKLRLPDWNPYAHIEIYLTRESEFARLGFSCRGAWGALPAGEGPCFHGPWVRLYDPPSMLSLGRAWDDYDSLLFSHVDSPDLVEWIAPEDYERFAAEAITKT